MKMIMTATITVNSPIQHLPHLNQHHLVLITMSSCDQDHCHGTPKAQEENTKVVIQMRPINYIAKIIDQNRPLRFKTNFRKTLSDHNGSSVAA